MVISSSFTKKLSKTRNSVKKERQAIRVQQCITIFTFPRATKTVIRCYSLNLHLSTTIIYLNNISSKLLFILRENLEIQFLRFILLSSSAKWAVIIKLHNRISDLLYKNCSSFSQSKATFLCSTSLKSW